MTQGDTMSEQHDCGSDAAAFVLGALEPSEADAFRAHMATCVVCRDEVATLEHVVDALPMAAPQYQAPRALRRRVFKAIRSEPRQTPATAGRWSRRPSLGLAMTRAALGLGMAVVVALAVAGGIELGSPGSSGTRLIQASVPASSASAQLRVTGAHGELIVRDMPPPPSGKVYEIWLQRGTAAPSPTSALFSVTSSGSGDVGVPGSLHGVSRVLVTPEPAGGSRAPTHAPVVIAQLT